MMDDSTYNNLYKIENIKKALKDIGLTEEQTNALLEILKITLPTNQFMISGYPLNILIRGQTNEW